MTKQHVLINDLPKLSTGKWNKFGLLSGEYYSKDWRWKPTGPNLLSVRVNITIETIHADPYVQFKYSLEGEDFEYKIPLIKKPSNSGRGMMWYMMPEPSMYCRKVFFHQGRFKARKQIPGAKYRSQLLFGKKKKIDKSEAWLKKFHQRLKREEEKYYKPTYANKPTKNELKILEMIAEIRT